MLARHALVGVLSLLTAPQNQTKQPPQPDNHTKIANESIRPTGQNATGECTAPLRVFVCERERDQLNVKSCNGTGDVDDEAMRAVDTIWHTIARSRALTD